MNFFLFGDTFGNSALPGSIFCPFGRVSAQLNIIKVALLNGVKLEDNAFNFIVDIINPDTIRMIIRVINGEGLGDLDANLPQVVRYCGIIRALQRGLYNKQH